MTQEPSSSIPPAGQTDYIYYAFVSYSHKDGKWAKWIQNALERYRLPAALRREAEKPLPIRIHPVFRDSTDLGVGKLAETLRKELDQSKYLIVVCSPNSARPNEEGKHWVNEEVARFCELGHADRIIPVIVGGTKDTAYCPKLLEEDILGLDATKHPKPRILNDLVAKILGLRPDELWRREERRLRARRRWRAFGASFIAAFLALGVYAALDSTRTVTRAFADYVDSYGLPEGRGPLSPEQVASGHVHYRFEFQGYRFGNSIHADSAEPSLLRALGWHRVLKRVVHSEAHRLLGRNEYDAIRRLQLNRPVVQTFEYGKDGRVEQIQASYSGGTKRDETHVTEHFRWIDAPRKSALVSFTDSKTKEIVCAPLAIQGFPGESGTGRGIFGWNILFDDHGRPLEMTFLDSSGHPSNGSDSDHPNSGLVFGTDQLGRISMIRTKGRADGVASGDALAVEYLREPARLEFRLHGQDGPQTVLLAEYDASGRPGTVRFPENKARRCILFTPHFGGNVWEGDYIPLEFRDVIMSRGAQVRNRMPSGWNSLFDGKGNETQRRFVDADGTPTMVDNGYAGWDSVYDGQNREIQRMVVGLDDRPIAVDAGPAGWKKEWSGDLVSFTYLDKELAPVLCRKEHFASMDSLFDEAGNIVKRTYKDASGRPYPQPDGHAGWEASYDSEGNETNRVFFGESLSPILLPEGFSGYSTAFDTRGHPVSRSFLGIGREPVVRHDGFHRWVKGYNLLGTETNCLFYGTGGQLVLIDPAHVDSRLLDDDGLLAKVGPIAGWWKEFSPGGELMAIGTVGTNGLPLLNEGGWAVKRFTAKGEVGFDSANTPIAHPLSTNIVCKTVGSSPFLKTSWYFREESGENCPANGTDGPYGVREWFDDSGWLTNKLFLAKDGTPFVTKDGYAGISHERISTSDGGRKVVTTWYDADRNPVVSKDVNCAIRVDVYDDWDYQTTTIDYDERGHLLETLPDEGAAYRTTEYIHVPGIMYASKCAFFGTNGLPVVGEKSGWASMTFDYDDHYSTVTYHYFGADGLPLQRPGGYWGYRVCEDPHENTTNTVFLDMAGKPVVSESLGYASCSKKYDYSWNSWDPKQTSEAYFDADGNLVAKKTGEAGWEDKFDDRGRQIERTYFGTNGKPVMTKYGFAVRKMFYDDSGVETNRLLLDADGKPVPPKKEKGSTKKKMVYSWKPHHDESGLLVLETYEAEDGTLGQDSLWSKTSSILYRYDEHGRETNRLYRGLQGQPVIRGRFPMETGVRSATAGRNWMGESGYSELRCRYTPDGLLAEKSFWGTNGAPLESSSGSHVIRYAYDATGAVTEERHFSTNGTPCVNQSGYHAKRISRNANGQAKVDYLDVDGCTELCEWQVGTVESADLQVFSPMPDIQPNDILVKKRYAHVFPLDEIIWYSLIEREEIFSLEEKWIDQMGIAAWLSVSMFARKGENGYDIHAFRQEVDSRRQRFGPPVLLLGVTANKKNTRLPVNDGEVFLQSLKEWLKDLNEDNIVDIRKSE